MKTLRLVSDISNSSDILNDTLYITETDDGPSLVYSEQVGNNIRQVIIDEGSSNIHRPIRCSELYNRLSARDWNITERKFVSNAKNDLMYLNTGEFVIKGKLNNGSSEIDKISTTIDYGGSDSNQELYSYSVYNPFTIKPGTTFSLFTENLLNSKEGDFKEMDVNEIYLFNTSRRTVDLINESVVIDVVGYNSDSYTNIVDLREALNSTKSENSNTSCKIEMTVQYSKRNISTTKTDIYCRDIVIDVLDSKGNKINLVQDVNDDVRVEFINGVLKVVSTNNSVIECIIRSCIITYGNIN